MLPADAFAYSDDNEFPTDHGAKAEGQRDLCPRGDELGGSIQMTFVASQRRSLVQP